MQYKIMVVSNSDVIINQIKPFLQKEFTILLAQSNQQALNLAEQNHDLKAALIYLPDNINTAQALKNNFNTYQIPLIAIVENANNIQMNQIDDFLQHSNLQAELKNRLLLNIQKTSYAVNPLTQLPANNAIIQKMEHRLNQSLAVLYIDLDNFKSYNDKYGFLKGDEIIKQTSNIIRSAVKKHGNRDDFVGHIGGDDFVIISKPESADAIANTICKNFDQNILQHYNKEDQKNKKVFLPNRHCKLIEYPIMSISIAVVTNETNCFDRVAPIIQIAAQLKRYAKTKPGGVVGSNFVKERRKYEKYIRNTC